MAPCQRVYFDSYQAHPIDEEPLAIGGMTPTDSVYAYEPIPKAMSAQQARHVLGAQGQLWTEYVPTMAQLEYMAYPRTCALAEVLWIDPAKKDYAEFLSRLSEHRKRLAAMNVNAHPRP
jgi:hexosaminidase